VASTTPKDKEWRLTTHPALFRVISVNGCCGAWRAVSATRAERLLWVLKAVGGCGQQSRSLAAATLIPLCLPLTAANSLQKAHFVECELPGLSGQQGVATRPAEPPEGRKVKSGDRSAVRRALGRWGRGVESQVREVSGGRGDDPADPLAMANLHTFAVTGPSTARRRPGRSLPPCARASTRPSGACCAGNPTSCQRRSKSRPLRRSKSRPYPALLIDAQGTLMGSVAYRWPGYDQGPRISPVSGSTATLGS
jgi:hypothetical protein